jgi:general secretion pathway protein N
MVVVATVALTAACRAPAAWLGELLAASSRLRLVDARGTVWQGSAILGVSDGRETTLLPGRVEWQLQGVSSALLSHPWLTRPLGVSFASGRVAFGESAARVPAGVLAALGAPFNTVRPGGVLEIAWSDSEVAGSGFRGEVRVDWREARSALSTVAPLGAYRLLLSGTGAGPSFTLQTLEGPLQLSGTGRILGSRVRFEGIATAEPQMRSALDGLLGVLGMRSGDKVLLAINT